MRVDVSDAPTYAIVESDGQGGLTVEIRLGVGVLLARGVRLHELMRLRSTLDAVCLAVERTEQP